MSETPGTSADPETGAEGDSDQLDREDTLVERGVDDLLDEGWSPPDHPSRYSLETEREQYEGDTLDERLAQEEPEVWDREEAYAPGREPDRAGRLVAGAAGLGGASASSLLADDAGVAGGAASAEEAAIHVVPDDAL